MACASRPINLRSNAADEDALDPVALSTKLDNPTSKRGRAALGPVVHLRSRVQRTPGRHPRTCPPRCRLTPLATPRASMSNACALVKFVGGSFKGRVVMAETVTDGLVADHQEVEKATRGFRVTRRAREVQAGLDRGCNPGHLGPGRQCVGAADGHNLGRKALGWGSRVGLAVDLSAPPVRPMTIRLSPADT